MKSRDNWNLLPFPVRLITVPKLIICGEELYREFNLEMSPSQRMGGFDKFGELL